MKEVIIKEFANTEKACEQGQESHHPSQLFKKKNSLLVSVDSRLTTKGKNTPKYTGNIN